MNDDPKSLRGKELLTATCGRSGCKDAGTYMLKAKCYNCRWTGTVVQTVGHMTSTFRCPNCGCEEVRRV